MCVLDLDLSLPLLHPKNNVSPGSRSSSFSSQDGFVAMVLPLYHDFWYPICQAPSDFCCTTVLPGCLGSRVILLHLVLRCFPVCLTHPSGLPPLPQSQKIAGDPGLITMAADLRQESGALSRPCQNLLWWTTSHRLTSPLVSYPKALNNS